MERERKRKEEGRREKKEEKVQKKETSFLTAITQATQNFLHGTIM